MIQIVIKKNTYIYIKKNKKKTSVTLQNLKQKRKAQLMKAGA